MRYHLVALAAIFAVALGFRLNLFLPSNYWLNYGDLGDAYLGYACGMPPSDFRHTPMFLGDWMMVFAGRVMPCELAVSAMVSLFQVLPMIPLWLFLRREANTAIAYACIGVYLTHPWNVGYASAAAFKLFAGITVFGWVVYRLSGPHKPIEEAAYPVLALFANIYIWLIVGLWEFLRWDRTGHKITKQRFALVVFALLVIPFILYAAAFKPKLFSIYTKPFLVMAWDHFFLKLPAKLPLIIPVLMFGLLTRFKRYEWIILFAFMMLPWYEPGATYFYYNRFTTPLLFISVLVGGLALGIGWKLLRGTQNRKGYIP